jgi:hypothetical protein
MIDLEANVNPDPKLFLSYAGEDEFEAALLQWSIEALLGDVGVTVWTYQRDQVRDQRSIGRSLKEPSQGVSRGDHARVSIHAGIRCNAVDGTRIRRCFFCAYICPVTPPYIRSTETIGKRSPPSFVGGAVHTSGGVEIIGA